MSNKFIMLYIYGTLRISFKIVNDFSK